MLFKILFFEISHAFLLGPTLQSELSNVIMTLSSYDLSRSCLEREPCHRMLLAIQEIYISIKFLLKFGSSSNNEGKKKIIFLLSSHPAHSILTKRHLTRTNQAWE
jgi:hypothetical protein